MEIRKIHSGESVAVDVLRVKSVPHISILSTAQSVSEQEIVEDYALDMKKMFGEIYQLYKEGLLVSDDSGDISLELLWITEPIENQTYEAKIELYLIVRSINHDAGKATWVADKIIQTLKTALSGGKYDVDLVGFSAYCQAFSNVTGKCSRGIVREERLENLQNQFMPYCYSYDRFPTDYGALSRIAGALVHHPHTAVSFQLIPTFFNSGELGELSKIVQGVSMLSRGMSEQNVGQVSITSADRLAGLYRYYSENKTQPLYLYNIVVYADDESLDVISARVVGQLGGVANAAPPMRYVNLDMRSHCQSEAQYCSLPWVVGEMMMNSGRRGDLWNSGLLSPALYRMPYIVTSDEAALFFRLPVATDNLYAGLSVNESLRNSKTYRSRIINAGDLEVGVLKSSDGDRIGLSLGDLAKHMLIVGTPGSGKTTFSVGLLDRLWKDYRIPFIVIEPAKNEYRALVQSIPELQVFTPGKNFISPFVLNPFLPPKNVRLETYKSTLKTAFAAGVSMSTPLDKIFEDTINNCYSDFRWLDSYTTDNQGKIFNITDFIKCFQETFDEIGYTGDARNIGRAGIVRLKSLVNLFDNYHSIPIEDLMSKPTVIELAAIENSDQKALIIALLLLSILAYVNANYIGEGGLRNFILVEEAHVLLDNESSGGEGAANPAAIAQGLVKRMLAEIRSYGVGLGIADQSPRKVGTDIVALTDIKVAFRLVEGRDKEILADATSMTDVQRSRLAKLKPGEAFLFFNRLDEPEEVVTPDYRLSNNISISLSDQGIKELSKYWSLHPEWLRPYPQCAMTPYCRKTCDYGRRLLAREVARRIFKNNIGAGCKELDKLRKVMAGISRLVQTELNDEPFNRELLSCVKVHLWRMVGYESNIKVGKETVNKSLIKE